MEERLKIFILLMQIVCNLASSVPQYDNLKTKIDKQGLEINLVKSEIATMSLEVVIIT